MSTPVNKYLLAGLLASLCLLFVVRGQSPVGMVLPPQPGVIGPQGAQGQQGIPGIGTTGAPGTNGTNGSNGTDGAAGPAALTGTTSAIGGGLLLAAGCTSGMATVTGATTAMTAAASPVTYPGDGAQYQAYVSSANTVTVKVCALLALTPVSSVYRVRVIQ